MGPFWLTPTAGIIADTGNEDPRKELLRVEVFNFVLARGIFLLSWSACTVILLGICKMDKNMLEKALSFYGFMALPIYCGLLVPAVLFGIQDVVTVGEGDYVWLAFSGWVQVFSLVVFGIIGVFLGPEFCYWRRNRN